MLKIGIIGFGGMGHVHASQYVKTPDTCLTAVADIRPEQLKGQAMELNIGPGEACDMQDVATYLSGDEMLAAEALDLVSVCLPTDIHADYTVKALTAGCHVLCEKPMSRTLAQADDAIVARDRSGKQLMVAQCLRFWPCYERLVEAYGSGEFGKLLMLSMRRVSAPPGWGAARSWFMDGTRSGGALLDMHIHDTDFANHLLGVPTAVTTVGTPHCSGAIDNAVTHYHYDGGPVVMAETSWSYSGGFKMGFCALFENATLEMGYQDDNLTLLRPGQLPETLELPSEGGYEREIAYLIDCIRADRKPERCTAESTRETMRIALAEEASALAGGERVAL